MTIPTGVNHTEFYKLCVEKGIKITSKFKGVVLSINYGKPFWAARLQKDKKNLLFKRFPFTDKGEQDAKKRYDWFLSDNQITPRYSTQKKYKNKKCK